MKKLMSTALAIIMVAGIPVCVRADGYSSELLGESFRDYSGKKIQQGYYPEIFTKIDLRQHQRVAARNQAEQVVAGSYQAGTHSNYSILSLDYLQKYNSDTLKQEIQKFGKQRIENASAISEFTYVPNSDGKITYFKDGLTSRVVNERLVNEFGVISLKDTYNMKYNDDRLLINYEADTKDNLGNISHLVSKDMAYMPGAKFYANEETNAHRNMAAYTLVETDHAGNTMTSGWKAGSYEGKLLRSFSVEVTNEVFGDQPYTTHSNYERSNIVYENNDPDRIASYEEEGVMPNGLDYRLLRTNITYTNNDQKQVTGFHEERWDTQVDGLAVKTTVDAEYEYIAAPHQFGDDVDPDPMRIAQSTLNTTTENPNGSIENETKILTYEYDKRFNVTSGSGTIEKNGRLATIIEYRDAAGHELFTSRDADGAITGYFYRDANDNLVAVAENEIVAVGINDTYTASGTVALEVVGGIPMPLEQELTSIYYSEDGTLKSTTTSSIEYTNGLVNNEPKVISYHETSTEISALAKDYEGNPENSSRDVIVTNIYDSKGNLLGAAGTGTGSGYEVTERGWKHYAETIAITYRTEKGYLILDEDKSERVYEQ